MEMLTFGQLILPTQDYGRILVQEKECTNNLSKDNNGKNIPVIYLPEASQLVVAVLHNNPPSFCSLQARTHGVLACRFHNFSLADKSTYAHACWLPFGLILLSLFQIPY